MTDNLGQLHDAGVSIWLDDLSRERLDTGQLRDLVGNDHVTGVTTNPSIFAKAIEGGAASYQQQLADLSVQQFSVDEAVRAMTATDVRRACDVMHGVWQATGGVDGRVSLEVDPRLAHDTEATIAAARHLWWLVDRPNLLIKIPATVEGLPAITTALGEGISVNVTLIFSPKRYAAVADAWLAGLEQAAANGHDLATIESVASFFVSRVDTEVDKRLAAIGSEPARDLLGKAGVANARLAFQHFQGVMASDRWEVLAGQGAHPQRPLWASTSTKNPDYPDDMYVVDLVTAGTVNTMPEQTMRATADHGTITGDTITGNYADARAVWDGLAELGIDADEVFAVLEKEGVDKFAAAWADLLATVAEALGTGTEG